MAGEGNKEKRRKKNSEGVKILLFKHQVTTQDVLPFFQP